jgi:NAD(P)-dependent dehydrogenase (short-subunit alcohol dehydrogenase family)
MTDLKNKNILITGASSGIGRASAILCDQLGANAIITGRNTEELNKTAGQLKNKTQQLSADLSSEDEINKLVSALPDIDGFVHCAGIIQPVPIKFLAQKSIDDIFRINFNSAVLLSGQLLRQKKLNSGASVVFISSVSSHHPYTGGSLYTSSKAALESFAKGLALETAPKKIRVNTISPALVRTKIWDQAEEIYSKEEVAEIESRYPLGLGEPADIANLVAFLLGSSSKWMTGSVIQIDGGLLLNNKI